MEFFEGNNTFINGEPFFNLPFPPLFEELFNPILTPQNIFSHHDYYSTLNPHDFLFQEMASSFPKPFHYMAPSFVGNPLVCLEIIFFNQIQCSLLLLMFLLLLMPKIVLLNNNVKFSFFNFFHHRLVGIKFWQIRCDMKSNFLCGYPKEANNHPLPENLIKNFSPKNTFPKNIFFQKIFFFFLHIKIFLLQNLVTFWGQQKFVLDKKTLIFFYFFQLFFLNIVFLFKHKIWWKRIIALPPWKMWRIVLSRGQLFASFG